MSVNIREKIGKLSPVQRRKVERRAAELIAEEMSLRDLRKARKLTQARLHGAAATRRRFLRFPGVPPVRGSSSVRCI